MTQQIIQNAGDTRKYFHILPHLADDDLNPYQYRLYGHYVRVCGVSGYCDESVRTTARKTQMSVGKVVQARTELAALGFILCTFGAGQNDTVRITLLDRWAENVARYAKESTWQSMSPKPAKPAGNLLNAFLRGDALNGVWNAVLFVESMSALLTHLATSLANELSLKASLAQNVDNPVLFFTTLSQFMKAAGLDSTICSSYAMHATPENIAQALNNVFITRTPRSSHEHRVHHMNTSEVERCSPGEPKKNRIKNQSKKNHYYKKPDAEDAQQDDMNRGGGSPAQSIIPDMPVSKPEVLREEKSSAKKEDTQLADANGLATISRAYEENIGLLTPMLRDGLKAALEDYPAGWIVDAIGVAVKAEKRFWSYVEGILKRWKRDGRDTAATATGGPTKAVAQSDPLPEAVAMPAGYVLPTEDEYERNLQEE